MWNRGCIHLVTCRTRCLDVSYGYVVPLWILIQNTIRNMLSPPHSTFLLQIEICHRSRRLLIGLIHSSHQFIWMAACVFCAQTHTPLCVSLNSYFSQNSGMFGVTLSNWFCAQQTADCEDFFPLCSQSQDAPLTVIWGWVMRCRGLEEADGCWGYFTGQQQVKCSSKCSAQRSWWVQKMLVK